MKLEELEVGDTFRISSSLGRGSIWKVTSETMGEFNLITEGVHGKSKGVRQMMGRFIIVKPVDLPWYAKLERLFCTLWPLKNGAKQ